MPKRIVVVGGGSAGWGPKLLSDLLLTPSLSDSVYVLHDLNATNAERIARFARKLAGELGVGATIQTETDPDRAIEGADFVVVTISTGGLAAMANDLAIPEEYGIFQTVGDTAGPGGWSRTLRNVPVFVELARRIDRLAPNAVVLNYTNPMTTLTKTLARTTKRPVVGLCHGLFENLEFLRQIFEVPDESHLHAVYGGVNHFFWTTSLVVDGRDGLAALRDRLERTTLPALLAEVTPGRDGYYLADELFRFTGLLPYLGDRHTCEFFAPYITSMANQATYHLKRTTIEERRERLRRTEAEIERMTAEEIPEHYRKRSRETAADIIDAFVAGKPFVDVGNVPNVGQIANLPRGAVVETPVLVTPNGFQPIAVGPLPEPARTWVERQVQVHELTVAAALEGDEEKAIRALALDPAVSHLTLAQIRELGTRLRRANADFRNG
ncbi:MAG TPA: hypothetical protein VFZ25_03675 [Chloroflexota bacterium]|nr:hypothetical protein [Chloroflexota bacterium]